MKKLILLFTILFALSAQAGHFIGSNISWKCVGPSQYIFELVMYVDCSSTIVGPVQYLNGPQGSITATREAIVPNNDTCGTTISCIYNAHVFKSDTITLVGQPPAAGWNFSYSDCCRVGSENLSTITGHFNTAVMYANNNLHSPQFYRDPEHSITLYNKMFLPKSEKGQITDSLHYVLAAPLSSLNTSIPYKTNYSATNPFPNPSTNVANGPISIHPTSGHIKFDAKVGNTGIYYYATEIEQWQNGILVGVVRRDFPATVYLLPHTNNTPVAEIDTATYDLQRVDDTYTMVVRPGDTARFEVNGYDYDLNGSNPQYLTFSATGHALDAPWNMNSPYVSKAQIQPIFPQTIFTHPVTNEVEFEWAIAPEHAGQHGATHTFYFDIEDDVCAVSSKRTLIVDVIVKLPLGIVPDTLAICKGDSALLEGVTPSETYLWENASQSFTSTKKYPYANVSQSQYIYLKDGVSTDVIDSVYIAVTQPKYFALAMNNGTLYVVDSNAANNLTWYHDSVLVPNQSNDTLVPTKKGTYYVTGQSGICTLTSKALLVTQIVGLSEMDFSNITIFPNPATHEVRIENLGLAQKVYLVDLTGKVQREFALSKDEASLQITRNNLSSGIYFIKIQFVGGECLETNVVFE